MQLNKVVIGAVVALVLLIGIRFALGRANPQSDQQLIEKALDESIQATKEGRPGGVMDKLSNSLRVNELDTSGNRAQIANYIKNNKPDVTVLNKQAVVSGDQAYIVSPVTIRMRILTQTFERNLEEVRLVFKKEDARQYLIFPATQWKLAEITVPEEVISDFWQAQ